MKKITLIIGVVCLMSSCGIQFGNYERWKQINRPSMCKTQEIVDELMYYVQEDLHNGNLDSTVVDLYIDRLNEINCENCDEID